MQVYVATVYHGYSNTSYRMYMCICIYGRLIYRAKGLGVNDYSIIYLFPVSFARRVR